MNNIKKRILSFLFTFVLLQFIILMFPMAVCAEEVSTTEDEVIQFIYEPIKTKYGIFNKYNYEDSNFRAYYSLSLRNAFNTIPEFGLQVGRSYHRLTGKFTWENFAFTKDETTGDKVKTIYGYLATPQQRLMGCLSAYVFNDFHTHGDWWKGVKEAVGYQGVLAQCDNYYYFASISGLDFAHRKEDAFELLGWSAFHELYPNPYKGSWATFEDELHYPNLDLFAYISSDKKEIACQDGDVSIMDLSLTFADIKDPIIKKIYAVDKDGKADNLFKAGEPVYLKVEFDEPVRFSDNVANDHGLEIIMMDSNNNQISGKIVALKDTYLIIKFENTSISGDFVFTQVDLTPLFGNELWDLNDIFGEKGKSEGITINARYCSDLEKNKINYGYDKSLSLITDIAGNPLQKTGALGNSLKKQVYSIYRNCYVDGLAPKIEDIYYTKNMYNSDVKEKLGTHGSTDPSDLNAGPGDKITYYAVFNEHLFADGKSMAGYTSKMKEVLNVKKPDRNGDLKNVELDSWNITTPAPGVIDTKYKEAKTTVQFEEFILTEDMVCEDPDSKIRIKEIIFNNAVVTDMSGNVYDGEVDIDLNDNPIGFDLTKPQVTTVAGQSEKGYVPVYPIEGNKKQFYFPIRISDQTGTNLIDGTFSWINGIPGEKDYKFQYAVTESMASPADDEWKTGYTGQAYSFTQIETTQYVHIRLFDDVQYNLGFTSLKIMPRDYAGNIGDQSFSLDYSIDTGLPSASVANTSKTYDLSTGDIKAIINVEVNATDDNTGIQKVYYLWTDTGSDPPTEDSPEWKEAVGSFEPGKNSVNVKAMTDKITGSYTGVLYVKPVDMANNARVIRLGTFTHSDKAPEYSLKYSTEITAEAKLEITEITDDSAVVVMIKKPGTTDNYYVSVIDQNGYSGDILNNNSYTANPINDVYS